ncbi:MAG: hypothetical protein CM1200mP10_14990 [Candidatus Neomarinimicrobiota bacterium]|nr:MAG: hypothetical protein CM1200mP10_14990 [Candidatus Neomarinimicrobiota bacterium]
MRYAKVDTSRRGPPHGASLRFSEFSDATYGLDWYKHQPKHCQNQYFLRTDYASQEERLEFCP